MAYWLCQFGGWGAWFTLQTVALFFSGGPTPRSVALNAAMAATGLAATHGLRFWLKRSGWGLLRPSARAILPRLAAVTVLTAALVSLVVWAEIIWIGGIPAAETSFRYYLLGVLTWCGLLGLWLALYFGVKAFERSRAAEAAASTAQLETLKAQLNPHFLFNALNSIRALIAEDPARAQEAVTELSSLLRYTLHSPAGPLVPLAEEMEAVRHYLRLEQIRFEDRLQVRESIAVEALQAAVPPMLVQTLVENAIKHGLAREPGGGVLNMTGELHAGRLRLTVTNPGRLGSGDGIGLRNARERLALLAPGGTITLKEMGGYAVHAVVEIPQ